MSGMRDFLKVYWPLIAVALLGLIIAFMLMDPAPPKKIRFAAGAPGGAYHVYAERYQRLLAEQGVQVDLVDTAGSVENLVQGGLASGHDREMLRSLGGLFPEPFWVFVRSDAGVNAFGGGSIPTN